MEYERIIQAAAGQPWAIDEAKGKAIAEFLAFKASGGHYTAGEVAARISDKRAETMRETPGATAVIPMHGVMFQRAGMIDQMSGGVSTEQVGAAIDAAAADEEVKQIILHIDSPGGAVYGTRELASKVIAAKERKTVIAQVDSVAASAAYWVASQATEIAVTPGGDVGSIGVIAIHEDISRRLEAEGITETIISAGKYKAEGNPYEPLDEEARDHIQSRVDEAYRSFCDAVAEGRGVSVDEVEDKYGQGRMLSAQAALRAGMVDRIATYDETVARYVGSRQSAGRGDKNRYSRRALAARMATTKSGAPA